MPGPTTPPARSTAENVVAPAWRRPHGVLRAPWIAAASVALMGAALSASLALAAPSGRWTVHPDQTGTLTVTLDGKGASGLAAFDATVRYNPAVVAVASIAPGDALPEGSEWLDAVPDGDDGVFFGSYRAGDGADGGDGTLATLTFDVLGPGAHAIRLDPDGSGAYDASGASIAPPARLSLGGLAPPPIYLPFGNR